MSAPSWLAEMITEFMPTGTKEYRARLASVWCERDCIQFPYPSNDNGEWYTDFLDPDQGELFMFPNAAHDDKTDTLTMAIIYLEHYISEGHRARGGNI
jgi:phage terminase large subunit-like protein